MIQTLAPIVLRKKTSAEIRAGLPLPLRILTSPKTTLALGATLAGLVFAPAAAGVALRAAPGILAKGARGVGKVIAPKSIKGAVGLAVGVPTAVGVLASSKTARGFVDPRETFKKGKKIGAIIEDPGKSRDILGIKEKSSLKEKVLTGAKAAGLVGAAAAVGIGAVAATKKIKGSLAERAQAKAAQELKAPRELGFVDPQPVGLGGVPVVPRQISPVGAPGATQKQAPIQNIIQIALR